MDSMEQGEKITIFLKVDKKLFKEYVNLVDDVNKDMLGHIYFRLKSGNQINTNTITIEKQRELLEKCAKLYKSLINTYKTELEITDNELRKIEKL